MFVHIKLLEYNKVYYTSQRIIIKLILLYILINIDIMEYNKKRKEKGFITKNIYQKINIYLRNIAWKKIKNKGPKLF